jgi:hypothetical protein
VYLKTLQFPETGEWLVDKRERRIAKIRKEFGTVDDVLVPKTSRHHRKNNSHGSHSHESDHSWSLVQANGTDTASIEDKTTRDSQTSGDKKTSLVETGEHSRGEKTDNDKENKDAEHDENEDEEVNEDDDEDEDEDEDEEIWGMSSHDGGRDRAPAFGPGSFYEADAWKKDE